MQPMNPQQLAVLHSMQDFVEENLKLLRAAKPS